MTSTQIVLVTGGSGFVGVYCILQLLEAGYQVRTTVRSSDKETKVREMLEAGDAKNIKSLNFFVADLAQEKGWKEAIEGCTYVLHVASPNPTAPPKHEDDLIVPAREGTLRILRIARDARVKRVVVTSSFVSIGYVEKTEPYTEADWSILDSPEFPVTAYVKSKTLAERAAWDFIRVEGKSLELSVINPVAIFGPVLDKEYAASVEIVYRIMNGAMPGCPQLEIGLVDVRDVASLHILAMIDPKARGERYICCAPPAMTIQEISLALRERFGKAASRAPTRVIPNFLLRMMAYVDPGVAMITPDLGKHRVIRVEKAKSLGWKPQSGLEALVASAESLIKLGMVKGQGNVLSTP
jgi:nucleoside-diphosphate-sugar epimerase